MSVCEIDTQNPDEIVPGYEFAGGFIIREKAQQICPSGISTPSAVTPIQL